MNELRILLEGLFRQLSEDIEQAKKASAPVKLDQQAVGRVSRIDAIQQQQMQLSAVNRLELRVKQVERALQRMQEGEFGDCGNCEEPIGFERLSVRPEAILCISCAK